MLRLTRLLFAHDPQAAYGDFYERALFNAILGSQDPDTGMVTYFQSTQPGYIKLFCTPFDSFWCCTGTGIENHAKCGDSIYFHTADAAANTADSPANTAAANNSPPALFNNLFIASTLNWKDQGLTLKQSTTFPEAGKTRLEFTAAADKEITLHIRKPSWATEPSVTLNGAKADLSPGPENYFTLRRSWKTGDILDVTLPMALHTELLPSTTDTAAILFGPLVLVGALGHDVKPGEDLIVSERNIGNPLNDKIDVPTFALPLANIPENIRPTGAEQSPLIFKTTPTLTPSAPVTLVPYYKTDHQHYNMYWKIAPA